MSTASSRLRSAAEIRCRFTGPPRRAAPRPRRRSRPAGRGPSRGARSAGSCRRSRHGSAAPGGPGRPGPRAGPHAACPGRSSASSAARMVRPEKSTSSTSTTVLPSTAPGRHLGVLQGPGRAQPEVVAVQGDVERADRRGLALELADPVGQAAGQVDAAGRDAEQDDVLAAVGALQDLVRDAGQRPPDLLGGEYRFPGGTLASLGRLIAGATRARLANWVRAHGAHQSRPPSPSHRTVLKGCLRSLPYQAR